MTKSVVYTKYEVIYVYNEREDIQMKEKILEILEEVKPGFEFEGKVGLIDNGDLDSFDVITLVTELSEEFDIDIPVEEIVTENFDSVDTIVKLVAGLTEE